MIDRKHKQKTILIIDDEQAIRQSFADCLEDYNYLTITAENGRVGLEKFERSNVDLVLVDLRMPEVDGLEVLDKISDISPDTPLIVISGTGVISDAVEALRRGAWDYLLKPVDDFSILIHSVQNVLEKADLQKENRQYQLHLERMVEERTEQLMQANEHLSRINSRLKKIVETTRNLSSCREIDQFGALLIKEFSQHMLATGGSIYMKEENGMRLVHSLDSEESNQFISFPFPPGSVFERVFLEKQPIYLDDVSNDPFLKHIGWKENHDGAALIFPLPDGKGEITGILTLHSKAAPPFLEQDKEIGMILASYGSEALRAVQISEDLYKSEQQYQQAQKMESIGRLAGGISHDLNNLLSPIIGYSEILLGDLPPDDERYKTVEEIHHAGIRARELIRQLLAFSRKQTLKYKSLNINRVLKDFKKLLRRTIKENITFSLHTAADIGYINADISQIEQVVMNLAVNAADAMPEGGTLTLETEMVRVDEKTMEELGLKESGPYVMLAISDTGCGMDSETVTHIFDPFFTTKGELGTGLGLATVYGIIKQHGGNITVESEPGEGTVFRIYLPVSDKAQELEEAVQKKTADGTGSEVILLVEDNKYVRQLAYTILTRWGYTVLVAETGPEALEMLETYKGPLHLLLSDVIMPEMNGKELYHKISGKYPGIKTLFMSGYSSDILSSEEGIEAGAGFIQKPFTIPDFADKIKKVLGKK